MTARSQGRTALAFLAVPLTLFAAFYVVPLAYSVYTIAPETVAKFHGRPLFLTIPFVLYGIFRYLSLMYAEEKGGNPSEHLLTDRATLVNVLLWGLVVLLILAWPAA